MQYSNYLMHINLNRGAKGRFISGDGDRDGELHDRENRGKHRNDPDINYGLRATRLQRKNKYQYSDGTLTPEGKQRLKYEIKTNKQRSKKNRLEDDVVKDTDRWVNDDLRTAVELARASKNASDSAQKVIDEIFITKDNERLDLSKMTDKELQELINRERLELQYNDLFNKGQENKGKQFVKKALNVNSVVADTAIAGLTIATLAYGLYKATNG